MAYRLTKYERETIINLNEQDKTADIFTYNKALITKLSKLCTIRSDEIQQIDDNKHGGITYIVPKSWVKVSPPRSLNYTVEQRQEKSERMKALRAERFKSNT